MPESLRSPDGSTSLMDLKDGQYHSFRDNIGTLTQVDSFHTFMPYCPVVLEFYYEAVIYTVTSHRFSWG